MYLRQNTLQPIKFGPFLSSVDKVTPQSSLAIAQANMRISKDGGNFASLASGTSAAHDEDGWYGVNLSADDVDTLGELYLKVMMTGTSTVPVTSRYFVQTANVFDNDNLNRLDRNADLVESQRGSHTWQGNYFYVAPNTGGSHASGNRGGRNDPYASVQDCIDNAVTDSNHDVIFLVSDAAGSPTTLTEAVTVNKRYLFIRGPGRDFVWTRSGNGDTISITADGVELSGFQLNTAATGSGDGVQITAADFARIHNVWINATRGDGINILRGDNCQITDNTFTDTGQGGSGEGIHIIGTAGTSNNNVIRDNFFRDIAGDAILIEQGTTNNTTIANNLIEGATGWGINIGASSVDAVVFGNTLANNSSGDITDAGTTTVQTNNEQWSKNSITTEARLAELDAANIPGVLDQTAINVDSLATGTISEISAISDAPASPNIKQALMLSYMRERNDYQTTSSKRKILNDAGVAVLDAPMSDDGDTFTQGKLGDV